MLSKLSLDNMFSLAINKTKEAYFIFVCFLICCNSSRIQGTGEMKNVEPYNFKSVFDEKNLKMETYVMMISFQQRTKNLILIDILLIIYVYRYH